jgi:hypothetical protein
MLFSKRTAKISAIIGNANKVTPITLNIFIGYAKKMVFIAGIGPFLPVLLTGFRWGFFAHKKINRLAVFTLPATMAGFYKKNLEYITEAAVNPDRRRYAIPEEAPRHYIDLDDYGDSAIL